MYSLARIHKGGLSTNLGFRTSYDAFYAFFTNLVCKLMSFGKTLIYICHTPPR